jgi:hypothetical protein
LLGVDYPELRVGATNGDVSRFRVFGAKADVTHFSKLPRTSRLISLCGGSTPIQEVPQDAPLAALTRDNRSDRFKPSYGRRQERRALARQADAPVMGARPAYGVGVSVDSTSTGQNFLLKLKKVAFEGVRAVEFTAYGLCKQGGIPQF